MDEWKAELIAPAVKVGERGRGGKADPRFPRGYYQHVAPEDIVGRDPVDVAGAARSNRELAVRRPRGTANVRVFTPAIEEHGWASGHTVVEIVVDDMPFLVDSVSSYLTHQGHAIHLIIP